MERLDFYISRGAIDLHASKDVRDAEVANLEKELKDVIDIIHLESVTDKSYGYGADWGVYLLEWIIDSQSLEAFIRIGSATLIAERIWKFFISFNKKSDNGRTKIFLGENVAKIIAVKHVVEKFKLNPDQKIIFEYSKMLTRPKGSGSDKEFLIILRIDNPENKKHHDAMFNNERDSLEERYLVNINWKGDFLEVKKY